VNESADAADENLESVPELAEPMRRRRNANYEISPDGAIVHKGQMYSIVLVLE